MRPGLVAVLLVVLCSCGSAGEPSGPRAGVPATSVDDHAAARCPDELVRDTANYGLGPDAAATAEPDLPVPDAAWICTYQVDDRAGVGANRVSYAWVRTGRLVEVPASRLPTVLGAVAGLEVGDRKGLVCTADLGPRQMLVVASGPDVTGIVADQFGCGDVRLTDDPFRTAPGRSERSGVVPGVVGGPPELPRLLRDLAGGR